MAFNLIFSDDANEDMDELESDRSLLKRLKAVNKTLAYLQNNPHHPSLNTHKYQAISGLNGEEIFEAYAENNTPAAYRIFWHYGPGQNNITILAITVHP